MRDGMTAEDTFGCVEGRSRRVGALERDLLSSPGKGDVSEETSYNHLRNHYPGAVG